MCQDSKSNFRSLCNLVTISEQAQPRIPHGPPLDWLSHRSAALVRLSFVSHVRRSDFVTSRSENCKTSLFREAVAAASSRKTNQCARVRGARWAPATASKPLASPAPRDGCEIALKERPSTGWRREETNRNKPGQNRGKYNPYNKKDPTRSTPDFAEARHLHKNVCQVCGAVCNVRYYGQKEQHEDRIRGKRLP